MSERFKVGDHVTWNSEAGHVSGTIILLSVRHTYSRANVFGLYLRNPRGIALEVGEPTVAAWSQRPSAHAWKGCVRPSGIGYQKG
jgi:hypothetical protein